MIGCIVGMLIEKNLLYLLVDCYGVGYEIDVLMSMFYNFFVIGEKVVLFMQQIV